MTISSSLNAGVSGLNVNASKLATISDNIANSGTFGYKRSETDFSALVRTSGRGTFTAGGTSVTSFRDVEAKGALITTENATDLSISGRGMLPVTSAEDIGSTAQLPLMLTSTGGFERDADGLLKTPSGLVLMGWPANADGTITEQPRDTVAGLEPVRVSASQLGSEPTTRIEMGINLPADATLAGETPDVLSAELEYFGNLGTSEFLTAEFTPVIPADGRSNAWVLEISDTATPTANNPIARFDIVFDDERDSGGFLTSVTPAANAIGTESFSTETGLITVAVGGGVMELNVGNGDGSSLLTQFADGFAQSGINKNGAPVGQLSAIEVDSSGHLKAVYNTGFSRTLYQIPIADVPNLNGLTALDNQAFALSSTSGSLYLWDAGDGPTGSIVGFSREESTTDLAAELTELIQTQRAYSSNAKIIQTVDEMLQETTNIKR
ncbi:MAG: flagellar hook-basal body complex protein [Pseudomonadota bacterium]